MALDPKLLRRLFATGAVLAALVAAGFYLRGILKSWRQPGLLPNNIPEVAKQVATGFKYSKSDGSRTLFTVQAASFQQFKEGQRYELHDASIVLYGREGDRSDQISGSDFEYDKATGEITAKGDVHIDLETNSPVPGMPDAAVPEKSTVHLKTSGLTFNEKSGLAQTKELIEFRIPEAGGSAIGATYDSRANVLTLNSAVRLVTTGRQKATVTAKTATVLRTPQRIIMQGANIEQPPRSLSTDQLTIMLRADNTVERIEGAGKVHALREGPKGFDVHAGAGELVLDSSSQLRSGDLSGGITLVSRSQDQPAEGKAGRLLMSFGSKGRLEKARAEDAVEVKQGDAAKSQEIHAAAVDLYLRDGRFVEKATTSAGPAQIVLNEKETKSTISAAQFEAKFGEQNRVRSVFGTGNASVVSSTPAHLDRRTTSRDVSATFNDKGEISSAEQTGDFRYQEGERKGWADRARYNPADETYTLTGSPRFADSNRSLTADNIQISRKDSTAVAQGHVKSTYNQIAQPNGARLGSADPVHVTGNTMTINRNSGMARYTAARLWRGQQTVEAPVISFDSANRSLKAESDASGRVASVFVQPAKNGKQTPVNVTSDKLSYVDADRKAVFTGHVLVGIEGGTISADTVQVLLRTRGSQTTNELDRIVAQGDIHIKQPNREATGSQLVYTAAEEKFVLTGPAAHRPSIFDAERGQISGDSLTFFTHDGRVLVGSGEASQIQTQTKVQDASKK